VTQSPVRVAGRIVVILVGVLLLLALSPSTASACGVTYETGDRNGDCGGAAPVVGAVLVGSAAVIAIGVFAVFRFIRGAMSEEELAALLDAMTAGAGGRPAIAGIAQPAGYANAVPWTRPPTGTVGGSPTGQPTRIRPGEDESVRRSLTAENEVAVLLTRLGYRLRQNPAKPEVSTARARTGDSGNPEKDPDYLLEDHVFDCYSPDEMKAVRGIASEVQRKVERGQTQRVVLDLRSWRGDYAALRKQFDDWPIAGLRELVAVTPAGTVIEIPIIS
jgi:hypothetical protein